jgi:hypothetical protein
MDCKFITVKNDQCSRKGELLYNENQYCSQHYNIICKEILLEYEFLLIHAIKQDFLNYEILSKILKDKSLKPISETNSKSLGSYENEKIFDEYKHKVFLNMIKPENFSPSEKNKENLIYLIFSPEIVEDYMNKLSIDIHFCDNWYKGHFMDTFSERIFTKRIFTKERKCLKYNKNKNISNNLKDWNELMTQSLKSEKDFISSNNNLTSKTNFYKHQNRFGYPENEVVFDFSDSYTLGLRNLFSKLNTTSKNENVKGLSLNRLMYIYINPKHKDFEKIKNIIIEHPEYNWIYTTWV